MKEKGRKEKEERFVRRKFLGGWVVIYSFSLFIFGESLGLEILIKEFRMGGCGVYG